ncbi:MAG: hypothetical protein RLZZ397_409 [Pseudomonadota bacterium]|jgi:putative solute:sodium symporter small subunit
MPHSRVQIEQRYWQRVRTITLLLLLLWAAFTFGLLWFARDLNSEWLGWPIGFWLAAQGGMLIYLLIVLLYSRVMHHLDRKTSQDLEASDMKRIGASGHSASSKLGN